jgi:hypothetical protein
MESDITRIVQVEVEMPEEKAVNPWLATAGIFADDPTWEDFLQRMAEYRRHLDKTDPVSQSSQSTTTHNQPPATSNYSP